MAPLAQSGQPNRLLAALSNGERKLVLQELEPVSLRRTTKLELPNRRVEHIYFLNSGIASVVSLQPKNTVEVGIIGREGVTGLPVLNGNDRSPYSTYMQVGGEGSRMPAEKMRQLLEHPALRHIFSRWAQAFMIQTSQTAVANARGTIEERLARWLLMAHDRCDGDEIPLTHEFLSMMMGAGRPGVTEAIQALAKKGLVRGERGMVIILDRDRLLERAGAYYGVPESEYDRLLPPAPARTLRAV